MIAEDEEKYPQGLPSGLTLNAGRAWIPFIISEFVDSVVTSLARSAGEAHGNGVIVATCGPASLVDDVRRAFTLTHRRTREMVGGMELHEEAFHW